MTNPLIHRLQQRLASISTLRPVQAAVANATHYFTPAEATSDQGWIKPYRYPAGGWPAVAAMEQATWHARSVRRSNIVLLDLNKSEGINCPSCAWPNGDTPKPINFCESGARAIASETTQNRASADFFAKHSVTELLTWTPYQLEQAGRLVEPLQYNPQTDHYEPISWDNAFELVARQLRSLDHPDQAVFYTSGRASNEASFLYQLFVKCFGTNNMPDCSNMCHEPSSVGLKDSIGLGKATVTMADFDQCDALFSFGHNPGSNHPRMLDALRAISQRGGTIVSINPLRERGLETYQDPKSPSEMLTGGSTVIARYFYQPNIGSDHALITGMIKCLDEWDQDERARGTAGVFDHDFIQSHTTGLDALLDGVRHSSWQQICHLTGLTQAQITELAQIYRYSKRPILSWCMGITQHRHGTDNVHMLANLALLMGHIGKPGAGLIPIRGHSNVQGNRTMGVWEQPSKELLDHIDQVFGIRCPRQPGYNVVETLDAMAAGKVRVFMSLGGNFAGATPDQHRSEEAIRQCELTVQIQTKLNRSHLVHGKQALILPCLGRTEQDTRYGENQWLSIEDSMCNVVVSRGKLQPISDQLRAETDIVAQIAAATLPDSPIDWLGYAANYDLIRDKVAQVVEGFEDYNARLYREKGFYLDHPANRYEWRTDSGKATFKFKPLDDIYPDLLPALRSAETLTSPFERLYTLTSIRSHEQFNTTVYGMTDRYRGIHQTRRVLMMNPEDIQQAGLHADDWVDIQSDYGDGIERIIQGYRVVPYDIPSGNLAMYYPESNPLIASLAFDPTSGIPAFKTIPVTLRKGQAPDLAATTLSAGQPESA